MLYDMTAGPPCAACGKGTDREDKLPAAKQSQPIGSLVNITQLYYSNNICTTRGKLCLISKNAVFWERHGVISQKMAFFLSPPQKLQILHVLNLPCLQTQVHCLHERHPEISYFQAHF